MEATSGKLLSGSVNDEITHFTQDSRACVKGSMYIPLIGANHDGHDFIQSAFDHGAQAIITSKVIEALIFLSLLLPVYMLSGSVVFSTSMRLVILGVVCSR